MIALNFNQTKAAGPDAVGPSPLAPVVIPDSTLPAPTHARVAVRMVKTEEIQYPVEDDNGFPTGEIFTYTITHEVYRFIEDYDLSTVTTANIAVPAADGYTV